MLDVQALQPARLLGAVQVLRGLFGHGQEVGGVAPPGGGRRLLCAGGGTAGALVQALQGVPAQRLEEAEAPAARRSGAADDEGLLHEASEERGDGDAGLPRDGLRRADREAPGED